MDNLKEKNTMWTVYFCRCVFPNLIWRFHHCALIINTRKLWVCSFGVYNESLQKANTSGMNRTHDLRIASNADILFWIFVLFFVSQYAQDEETETNCHLSLQELPDLSRYEGYKLW